MGMDMAMAGPEAQSVAQTFSRLIVAGFLSYGASALAVDQAADTAAAPAVTPEVYLAPSQENGQDPGATSGYKVAHGWTVTPRINATETYTDNMFLAPSGQEAAGFITQLMPGINILGQGDRYNLNLDYALQDLIYDNYGWQHTYYNQLNATGNFELVKKTFFVDAGASISQQPLTPLGPVSVNSANLSGNVINTTTESISPYLVHQFGTFASAQARWTHVNSTFDYGGPSAGAYISGVPGGYGTAGNFSSVANTADVFLANGPDFNNLLWKVDYNNAESAFTGYPTTTISTSTLDLGYLLTPNFKLTSEVGYEHDNFFYFGAQPQGVFWNVGFGWAPSLRTKLEMSIGERFYGRTYSLNFTHRTRMTVWGANYTQSVTTSALQQSLPPSATLDQLLLTQIPDAATRQQVIQQMLAALGPQSSLYGLNVITNQVFLNKTFQLTSGITTPRNIVLLTAFDTKTDPLQQPSNNNSNDSIINNLLYQGGYLGFGPMDQVGFTLSWNNRITSVLSANLSASVSKFNFPGQSLQENMDYFTAGLSEQLSHKTFGTLSYRHQLMNAGQGGYNYTENALIAGITLFF